MTINNLYPPILDTYAPAFKITEDGVGTAVIPFRVSDYVDESTITYIQVSVRNQYSNYSELNGAVYHNDIYTTEYVNGMTAIQIPAAMLDGGKFYNNRYYKIQMRFTTASEEGKGNEASWMVTNADKFSEWSTICLVRPISAPSLQLSSFVDDNGVLKLQSNTLCVIGNIKFADSEEGETLDSYTIKVYQNSKLIDDSKKIKANNYSQINHIEYTVPKLLSNSSLVTYSLNISIVTSNGYEESFNQDFKVEYSTGNSYKYATVITAPLSQNGTIKITASGYVSMAIPKTAHVIVRRSDARSKFEIWEDVYESSSAPEIFEWFDYSVESDLIYKYAVQVFKTKRYNEIYSEPTAVSFDTVLLESSDHQVPIKYNPNISSLKVNVADNKQETIGAQFAFVKRNGNRRYKTFTISGLISAMALKDAPLAKNNAEWTWGNLVGQGDTNDAKTGIQDLYTAVRAQENITDYDDIFYEREFRDKIIDFLNEDAVRLYRSNTEGNMLIRLTDVSFTPVRSVGRMIYEFSATAVEVAACTIKNIDAYNIQSCKEE